MQKTDGHQARTWRLRPPVKVTPTTRRRPDRCSISRQRVERLLQLSDAALGHWQVLQFVDNALRVLQRRRGTGGSLVIPDSNTELSHRSLGDCRQPEKLSIVAAQRFDGTEHAFP